MNVRRILLDVDKAKEQPTLLEIAREIERVPGVEGANISVNDVDMKTVGMQITVEGENIDVDALIKTIDAAGAALHSIDEVVVGRRIVDQGQVLPRAR